MSCKWSYNNGMTSPAVPDDAAPGEENVMPRRLLSYYYLYMISADGSGQNSASFKY
jgi:hypothetical protein